jgi:hypothetical protein
LGTYYRTLVAADLPLSEAEERAARLREWLTARNIIAPEPMEFDEKRNVVWYREREGADSVTVMSPAERRSRGDFRGNGLGIGVGWQYAHPCMGEITLHCPQCAWMNDIGMAWRVLQNYHERREPTHPTCSLCGFNGELMQWHLHPPFAVGHLAVCLRDWPELKDDFLRELRGRVGNRVRYIEAKF